MVNNINLFVSVFAFGIVFFGCAAYYLIRAKQEKEKKEKEEETTESNVRTD
jgi:uncharacterized protein YutD